MFQVKVVTLNPCWTLHMNLFNLQNDCKSFWHILITNFHQLMYDSIWKCVWLLSLFLKSQCLLISVILTTQFYAISISPSKHSIVRLIKKPSNISTLTPIIFPEAETTHDQCLITLTLHPFTLLDIRYLILSWFYKVYYDSCQDFSFGFIRICFRFKGFTLWQFCVLMWYVNYPCFEARDSYLSDSFIWIIYSWFLSVSWQFIQLNLRWTT